MTRNVYVFGIGGTGARIIRSLTMLLAAGVKLNDTHKIIPIIIDVDAKNADTTRTLKALENYRLIRERGYGNRWNVADGSNANKRGNEQEDEIAWRRREDILDVGRRPQHKVDSCRRQIS